MTPVERERHAQVLGALTQQDADWWRSGLLPGGHPRVAREGAALLAMLRNERIGWRHESDGRGAVGPLSPDAAWEVLVERGLLPAEWGSAFDCAGSVAGVASGRGPRPCNDGFVVECEGGFYQDCGACVVTRGAFRATVTTRPFDTSVWGPHVAAKRPLANLSMLPWPTPVSVQRVVTVGLLAPRMLRAVEILRSELECSLPTCWVWLGPSDFRPRFEWWPQATTDSDGLSKLCWDAAHVYTAHWRRTEPLNLWSAPPLCDSADFDQQIAAMAGSIYSPSRVSTLRELADTGALVLGPKRSHDGVLYMLVGMPKYDAANKLPSVFRTEHSPMERSRARAAARSIP